MCDELMKQIDSCFFLFVLGMQRFFFLTVLLRSKGNNNYKQKSIFELLILLLIRESAVCSQVNADERESNNH